MISGMAQTLNRNSLKASTGRTIFCPDCRGILDCKRAVELALYKGDKILFVGVLCTTCFDKARAGLEQKVSDLGGRMEVLDGRELFKRNRSR